MTEAIQLKTSVEGMSCASCVGRVQRALEAMPGVSHVAVNLADESARLELRPEVTSGEVADVLDRAGYPARRGQVVLDVASMSCASCVGRVERALAAVPGVVSAHVNLAAETATVAYLQGAVTPADLVRVAGVAGYPATIAGGEAEESRSARKAAEAEALWRRTVLAIVLALPVFVLEMGGHMVPAVHHWVAGTIGVQTSWMIQFVLTTLVLAGPGRSFYRIGFPNLFKGAPDMNSLVAVGTSAAYGYSVVATFLPSVLPAASRAVYFEAAAVIVVLILTGRTLEARAKGRTGAAIEALLGLQVRVARVVRGAEVVEVPLDQIAVGDVIEVRPGERVATDGEVTDGAPYLDESMITGEALPVGKAVGDVVTGGTVNGAGSFRFRAVRVGSDTTLAQIIRMVEEAQGAKLPIQGLVDKITYWFVPAVLLAAVVTVVAWLVFGPDLAHALVAGVSVLIIACPCAMGLATPTSIMVGTGRAAELGVLFRKGDALQALAQVDVVALDKTGTLTEGKPVLTDLVLAEGFARDDVLALVAAVEGKSEHPVAAAIVAAAKAEGVALGEVAEFSSLTGYGVRARVHGRDVLVGADRLMAREGVEVAALAEAERDLAGQGKTALFAAVEGRLAAVLAVSDPLKATTVAAIAALKARGLSVAMITGDKRETAEAIAREAGIDRVIAGVLPEGKVAALDQLRAGGQRLAFVGDGVNDAPALAHADVGIAIGTGTDVAIEAADVVLMSGDVMGVARGFEVSASTLRNIKQNLFWAFGYNTVLIPVAAGVFYPAFGWLLSPVLAAGAMALSSVFVLSNALRLKRAGGGR